MTEYPDEVVAAYLFASVPSYLYRKLRETEYVQDLAKEPSDDLLERMRSQVDGGEEEEPSRILSYCLLTAWSIERDPKSLVALVPGFIESLQWGCRIIGLYDQGTQSAAPEESIQNDHHGYRKTKKDGSGG